MFNQLQTKRPERFDGVQMLRFVAALLVVITHSTYFISTRMSADYPVWNTGSQGARLFFVISGFIMLITALPLMGLPGAFRYFMLSRIVRIVPLYWVLNLLKIVQILFLPALALANPTAANIILSMLFIPSHNADGIIETFYGVGWTLNFEMAFYLLVGLALLLRRQILPWVGVIVLIAAGLSLLRTDAWPAVTYLFNPIVLNFLWGMVIAHLYLRGVRLSWQASLALAASGTIFMFAWPEHSILELEYAAIVAGVVWLEPYLSGRIPRWLMFGGDASYSLYLVHPVVGVLVAFAVHRFAPSNFGLAFCLIIASCLAASAVTYHWFEKPITDALRRRLHHPGKANPRQPAMADPA